MGRLTSTGTKGEIGEWPSSVVVDAGVSLVVAAGASAVIDAGVSTVGNAWPPIPLPNSGRVA